MTTPLATYRVQLHAGFTLSDLHAQLDYLHALGVDWIYASPVLMAVPGSTHGYDVADVARLNPELGDAAAWSALHERRRQLGLGWLQDIVPNHMAYDLTNPWVVELLKHGEASTVARHFDVDWRHPDYRGKVMLPILGAPLEEVIAEGHVSVDDAAGVLRVYDRELPLSARSLAKLAGSQPVDLDTVIADQHYALAYWQDTNSRINFRRFFTVNGLICLRQERAETFRATHALVLEWLRAGEIDGIRLDHIDGLLDPTGYLKRLREAVGPDVYILAEKILEHGERLPEAWPIQGTTGYDYLAYQNQLLRDPDASSELLATAASFDNPSTPVGDDVYRNKRWVLTERMAGELDNVVHHAQGALAGLPLGLDRDLLRSTIADWLSAFPVYRAYPRFGGFRDSDRRVLVDAVERALDHAGTNREGLELLRSWLRSITKLDDKTATFLQRAMQLSGPLMAKGIEDTTFYQRFEYLACNEVGDSPSLDHALSLDGYHDRMVERGLTELNATSTHDTKRAEDARARLHVMSARPSAWGAYAKTAGGLLAGFDEDVPRPLRYLLLQTIASSWRPDRDPRAEGFLPRAQAFAEKALRESKQYSNWAEPATDLETAVRELLRQALEHEEFRELTAAYIADSRPYAWLNTLRQLVLKCTAPGAPDVYQGTEYLDCSMVDPDNRRPVDYARRQESLREVGHADWSNPSDANKLAVLHRLLAMRRRAPEIWRHGTYLPLSVSGARRGEVLAFRRVHGDDSALVLVAVRTAGDATWPSGTYFGDATVELPEIGACEEQLAGSRLHLGGAHRVADLLAAGPAAVFLPSV